MTLGGTRRSCSFWRVRLGCFKTKCRSKSSQPSFSAMVGSFEKRYHGLKVYLKASHLSSKIPEMPLCTTSNRNQLYGPFSLSLFASRLKASKTTCAWTRLIFVTGWRWMACDEGCLPGILWYTWCNDTKPQPVQDFGPSTLCWFIGVDLW